MKMGAERIIEIIIQFDKLQLHTDDENLMNEIKTICQRWLDIQNDGNIFAMNSLQFIDKQFGFNSQLMNGLAIVGHFKRSHAREAFLKNLTDDVHPGSSVINNPDETVMLRIDEEKTRELFNHLNEVYSKDTSGVIPKGYISVELHKYHMKEILKMNDYLTKIISHIMEKEIDA